MKKFVAAFIAALLLVSSLSTTVCANSAQSIARDDLVREACEVFPEYTLKIRGIGIRNNMRSALGERCVVHSETRRFKENEQISYVEYSDGLVMIARSSYSPVLHPLYSSSTTGGTDYTTYITATMSYSDEVFQASSVKYTIYDSQYDKITSAGDLCDCTTAQCSFGSYQYTENAYSSAYVSYFATFTPSPAYSNYLPFEGTITLTVGNNKASVSAI